MNDFKGTPGPWRAAKGKLDYWYVTNDAGDPSDEYDISERGDEADARLIAAAPELLDAVKRYQKSIALYRIAFGLLGSPQHDAIREAEHAGKVAIAKAIGSPQEIAK